MEETTVSDTLARFDDRQPREVRTLEAGRPRRPDAYGSRGDPVVVGGGGGG